MKILETFLKVKGFWPLKSRHKSRIFLLSWVLVSFVWDLSNVMVYNTVSWKQDIWSPCTTEKDTPTFAANQRWQAFHNFVASDSKDLIELTSVFLYTYEMPTLSNMCKEILKWVQLNPLRHSAATKLWNACHLRFAANVGVSFSLKKLELYVISKVFWIVTR